MGRVFQPLLFLLARCTRNELIRQVEWFKAENVMLRKRVDKQRIFLDQEEKNRLMKLGQAIGPSLKHLITIVSYTTYLNWLRKELEGYVPKKMGRPRTAETIRNLIVKIGKETGCRAPSMKTTSTRDTKTASSGSRCPKRKNLSAKKWK